MISGRCTWGQAVPCLASRVIGVPLQMSSVLHQDLTNLMAVAGARGHGQRGSWLQLGYCCFTVQRRHLR